MKGKALIILAIVLCAAFFAFAFGLAFLDWLNFLEARQNW